MNKNRIKESVPAFRHGGAGKRFLPIFIAAFLALVLIFGAVLGIISAVNASRAAVKYNGVIMDEGTVAYFQSYYKRFFMSSLSASGVAGVIDEPAFWNRHGEDSEASYGELLADGCREYIANVIAANYLFDSYASVSSDIKRRIKEAVLDVVKNSDAEGDISRFDTMLESRGFGFGYASMLSAAEMIYKADSVKNIIYGVNGENLKNKSHPDAEAICDEYLLEYTHAKLLVINTETKYKLDANGNKIKGDDGYYETEPLTEKEKADRLAEIEAIRGYIAAIGTHDDQMTETMFDRYIDKYADGEVAMKDGYYFHPSASYTQNFPESGSDAVERALEMKIGEYSESKLDGQVCFIYKSRVTDGIYASTLAENCFTDFYSDLATKDYDRTLALYSDDVGFTEKYSSDALIYIPYNYEFVIPRL